MGTFTVRFTVRHPVHPDQQLELEGLVDTGAFFTQIPADRLGRIGIVASGTRAVHYADGRRDVVPVAKADIAIDGVETATVVLCGRPGSLVLLGATTLETLGLGVDSLHKKLIPVEAPMAAIRPVRPTLKRKSFFVDEQAVRRARRALGVTTDAEAVRGSVVRIAEMEDFWRFMKKTRATLRRSSFRTP